jgi:hypothetical protein
LCQDLEIKNEPEMTIDLAEESGAADGIASAVDLKACADQNILYRRVIDSFAGVILGQVSRAYDRPAVGGVARSHEFAHTAGEAGKKISTVVKQLCEEGVERKETAGGKAGRRRNGIKNGIEKASRRNSMGNDLYDVERRIEMVEDGAERDEVKAFVRAGEEGFDGFINEGSGSAGGADFTREDCEHVRGDVDYGYIPTAA